MKKGRHPKKKVLKLRGLMPEEAVKKSALLDRDTSYIESQSEKILNPQSRNIPLVHDLQRHPRSQLTKRN